MPKILICEKIDAICPRLFQEAEGFSVDIKENLSTEELLNIVADYDGLVVRSAVKVSADVIAKGSRLKVVGRAGAGVDTIDIHAATKAGILVMNTPGQNANAVAELVFGFMFSLVRHIVPACVSLREGRWEKKKFAGTELLGKTIGIIGYGAIGRRIGIVAQAIGMKVMAYDPFLDETSIVSTGAEAADLDQLLAMSDFVSLHMPKTKESTNMISQKSIEKMKQSAILINCARGGLVDEAALYDALKSGRLAAAAADVFTEEPPSAAHPLLSLDNFIATPHIGASTAEAQINVAEAIARQMIAFFKDGSRDGAVN